MSGFLAWPSPSYGSNRSSRSDTLSARGKPMDEGAVRRLFFRALDVAPESRAAFLENSSAPADVRAAVVTLLRSDAGSKTFLQQAVSQERPLVPCRERFGPYQL